jgi:hypothetical protein
MSFSSDTAAFAAKLEQRRKDVFLGTVEAVQTSITEGSPITGAPGQPVQWGTLKGSYQDEPIEDYLSRVVTNLEYAEAIEDGQQPPYTRADGTQVTPGPMTLRSEVGGFGSVKQTRANYELLVEDVARRVASESGPAVLRFSLDERRRP